MIPEGDKFRCTICNTPVERGIINMSGHWANCAGKDTMAFINKLADNKSLDIKDKMDLLKKELNIDQ